MDPQRLLTRSTPPSRGPLEAEPVPQVRSATWRREAIEAVWTTVRERHVDPQLNGVDWAAVRRRHEPQLLAAPDDESFWLLLDRMTGELRDSHTRVHSPAWVARQRERRSDGLGLQLLVLDGQLLVAGVHPQSDAWWGGVRAGMRVLAVDDEPAAALWQRLLAESRDASTPWARQRAALGRLVAGEPGTGVTLQLARQDESSFSVRVQRRSFATAPEFTHRVLPSGFGYIRFSGFSGGLTGQIVASIRAMHDTPGLVVDLRGNGGGSGSMATTLAGRFLAQDVAAGKAVTRSGKPPTLFFVPLQRMAPVIQGSGSEAYAQPLVVLVDEGSASASERFASVLQDAGRATVVGQRTCGCLLGFYGLMDLPGGGALAYSEVGYLRQDGSRVEGQGVRPDVEVLPTREDLLLGRDRALERAQAVLAEAAARRR